MEDFIVWEKKQKEARSKARMAIFSGFCFLLVHVFLLYLYFTGSDLGEEFILVNVIFGFFDIVFFLALKKYKNIAYTKEHYNDIINFNKKLEEDQKNQQIKKDEDKKVQELALEKKIKLELVEEFKLLDDLEKNVDQLSKVDFKKSFEFKEIIISYEKKISDKIGDDGLHKFLKISSFIDDLKHNLNLAKESINKEIDINYFKKTLVEDRKRMTGDDFSRVVEIASNMADSKGSGSNVEIAYDKIIKLSPSLVPSLKREINKIYYFDAIAKLMVLFLIEDKKILYLEILEAFEKLGALDTTWQKKIKQQMQNISNKLDVINNGIIQLNSNFNSLVDKNDELISVVKELNSTVKMNNAIQVINAFQIYKIKSK